MLRLALLGCGEHSRGSHAAPLANYATEHPGEIELVAACDLNIDRAEEFCRSFGFLRAYTDVDQMLAASKVDGCVCVLPMDHIVDSGVRMLERGIPCVIEKPLGTSVAEAERLKHAADETKTPHMVSVNRRFMPFLNRARSWANELGTLQYVRATQIRDSRTELDFIWATAIHVFDALRYIAGEVTNFTADIQRGPGLTANWYVISLKFESGATGQVEILPTAGMVEETYELFGEGFRARVVSGTGVQRSLECWQSGKLVLNENASDDEPEYLRNGSYQEVEEFVSALKMGMRPRPEVKDIFPSASICFAIADLVGQKNQH